TKRDLGFVEGDLIECLNAGDGSWWMGRLRRDKRMVGLFPSNFVQLLDENFQPGQVSRNTSPLPLNNISANPQKTKSVNHKPFGAYGGPSKGKHGIFSSMKTAPPPKQTPTSLSPKKEEFRIPEPAPRAGARPSSSRAVSPNPNMGYRAPSPAMNGYHYDASPDPRSLHHAPSPDPLSQYRAASPAPHAQHRASSPAPYAQHRPVSPVPPSNYRAYSPAPPLNHGAHSSNPYDMNQSYPRIPSPAPSFQDHRQSRASSPAPFADIGSSPPPPAPPPHRVVYNPQELAYSDPCHQPEYDDEYGTSGKYSPVPPLAENSAKNFTPSPLRDAMNDVMSSLQDMSMSRQSPSPERPQTSTSVWSPEAFDQVYMASALKRPQSAMGLSTRAEQRARNGDAYSDSTPSLPSSRDGQTQLNNYVQRMENRLREVQSQRHLDNRFREREAMGPPAPPLKGPQHYRRPSTSHSKSESEAGSRFGSQKLKNRKSTYELGREVLGRTFTTKSSATSSSTGAQSNSTNASNSTQMTSQSIMSGYSAGGISATSAGSLARRKWSLGGSIKGRPQSALDTRSCANLNSRVGFGNESRPQTPMTGITYHSSHDSRPGTASQVDWTGTVAEPVGVLGGLATPAPTPKSKRSGFFKKMIESAKTGAASARSTIATSHSSSRPPSPVKSMLPKGVTAIAGGKAVAPENGSTAKDMGLGGAVDWMQVRRDVNRSNSLSKNERRERAERCELIGIAVINPVDELHERAEGDEGLDGLPITEPTNFNTPNLALVDKGARFIASLPPMINPASLAQGYICRPYRSDVQRLRAIFTWVSERIGWEEDFEGPVDTRRVIQTKRGCPKEVAMLVIEMCAAVGLHAEAIRGYLKAPGEVLDLDMVARPNHWWNAVIVDGEWRIMDCSLAGPTNPKRSVYSSAGSQAAESWWFLARPMEICYTHVPLLPEQQHICPPLPHEVLMALPCACPPYFKNGIEMADFDTSLLNLENLELAHVQFTVPEDVECVAEVEARAFAQDTDGDFFESGELVRKMALCQAEWVGGRKRYTVKALLPGDEGQGVLKVYAGRRGLMHSVKDNPHPLALALPLSHTGPNPPYDFLTRHPTPHAQRHDLYVAQPQCARLALNNTFVFAVRQHPSSASRSTPDTWGAGAGGFAVAARSASPNPAVGVGGRPSSAMSTVSFDASVSGSAYSDPSTTSASSTSSSAPHPATHPPALPSHKAKPAKLAIQSPSGKIVRLVRKEERAGAAAQRDEGGTWETVIKIGERGVWRALVLADRSARWCVFGEWSCA
ncbi:hypothetical protein LTR04_000674, partial [Oleoguttula sp. CCFEE 6159]